MKNDKRKIRKVFLVSIVLLPSYRRSHRRKGQTSRLGLPYGCAVIMFGKNNGVVALMQINNAKSGIDNYVLNVGIANCASLTSLISSQSG